MFEDDRATWQELVDAARRTNERLGPLAAEKAKLYEGLTLEQLMARWAEVMSSRGESANVDHLEAEVMAIYRAIGSKVGKRVEALRAGGFDFGGPMQ